MVAVASLLTTGGFAQTGLHGGPSQAEARLPYRNYLSLRGGLGNFYNACLVRHKATVAFLGGSITYNPGWRDKTCAWLRERYPETEFRFIAAGIPSLGSLPHVFRLQQDVLDSGAVDLLFLEAAVNDRVNGTDSITQVRSLEGIVRHARTANPAMDIVMMAFADPDKTSDYDKGMIPVEIANQEMIAAHYGLPSINLGKEVRDKIRAGEFDWKNDFKDVHPSPFGQELYFANIRALMTEGEKEFDGGSRGGSRVGSQAGSRGDGPYRMPAAIDKASFVNGVYLDVAAAKFDGGWRLSGAWKPADSARTRAGFVNVPVLESSTPGAALELRFTGTAIGMAVVAGPDAGIVEYSIDHGASQKVRLYTQWSSWLHLPWYVLFAGGLKNKQHILQVRISDEIPSGSKGHACRIVHFLVNK
ncbi:SGNH/GDSL hydrolase family protein [Puia sp. P3]|uniref:SGNH/GDSL hydrolase family protein n=1 Tax=Puia sp. P3 TaxID=3423952 RepID=UPI003D66BD86